MNQLTLSPSNSPRQLSSTTAENHRDENNTTIFSLNGYSRNIESTMGTSVPVRNLKQDEEFRPAVDIKSRNLTTMPFSNDMKPVQESPRAKIMQEFPTITPELCDALVRFRASRAARKISELALETSLDELAKAQESAHQAMQSLLPKALHVLQEINQACDEAKEKTDEALEITQIQISSNELTQKEMIEQLQDTQNTFEKIVANDILDPINFNFTSGNAEVNKTLTSIGTLDQV